ncbi:putative reverse transcriptase domain-containing protein [Tanacetum coccineum]
MMNTGFLNQSSKASKVGDNDLIGKGSLLGDLASKIRNIDGKILGRDGKPMVARRCVRFADATKESICGDERCGVNSSSLVKTSSHDVAHPSSFDQQVCTVNMDEDRPDLGCNCTMVNETGSQSNKDALQDRSSVVSLPNEAIDEINACFVNTLYGFHVRKRLAFPMVDNYVKHAWMKFGLKRVMMHHGFFMFQFESKSVAYSKVGLDLISAKVGRLMRLDAHTQFICLNSWGRSDYARALVEVSADKPLVDLVDIDIPREDGKGHITVTVRIEFEWQPPRCGTCKIFDHLESMCPMKRVASHATLRVVGLWQRQLYHHHPL